MQSVGLAQSERTTSAERTRRYRERLNADPVRKEEFRRRRLTKYQEKKLKGELKAFSVTSLPPSLREKQRELWRNAQFKYRTKKINLQIADMSDTIRVNSPNVRYTDTHIESQYTYHTSTVHREGTTLTVSPSGSELRFRTERHVPRLGVMLVGWGGNNGSTVTAAVLANRLGLTWRTRTGEKRANYYGSLLQASTVCLGSGPEGEVNVPFRDLLPMVHPDNIIFDGWDISSLDLGRAMERAEVLDWSLQEKLRPHMSHLKPRPSIYIPEFIAANQESRADNVLRGSMSEQVDQIRADIRSFQCSGLVDKVIVLWTANTERFCDVTPGVNDTAQNLLAAIKAGAEVSPSTLFAVASILEGCAYINGSPQNTFVPGAVELAVQRGVFIGGDDFKSGQTKIKSVLVDFLVSAGIKPTSIVSYNHLGNNDGMNLSAPQQFRSKEISKSNVVDDMVQSNPILYAPGEKPDHCVVIKYVPGVGDSKRAMDEYTSEIMMGGTNTIAMHNTCEDSLLASPIILDLVILTELCQRVTVCPEGEVVFQSFHSVLALLSYLCKAPLVPPGAPLVNAFFRQRACIENIMRACLGLPPQNHMHLEHKLQRNFLPHHNAQLLGGAAVNGHPLGGAAVNGHPLGGAAVNGHPLGGAAVNGYVLGGTAVNGHFPGDAAVTGHPLGGAAVNGYVLGGAAVKEEVLNMGYYHTPPSVEQEMKMVKIA